MTTIQNEMTNYTMVLEKEKNDNALQLRQSPEVHALIRGINLEDPDSLMKFGSDSADEVSNFADQILRSVRTTKTDEAGQLIQQLDKIMERFDIKDFDKIKEPGLLQRIFSKAKTSLEAIFKKYETMEGEVGKVHVTLKQYESDIYKENEQLETMFRNSLANYENLQKYIVATEMALEEINTKLIPEWEQKAQTSGDPLDQINVQKLYQGRTIMEQKLYDLKVAENVSLQSLPLIKVTQTGNYELVRKINSSFMITLPLFKQALAQTVLLKRQDLRAKSLKALDERTNELLERNANNTMLQAKAIAQLSTSSIVDVNTLEKSWKTIMDGIEDVKQIYVDASKQREENTKRLEQFKTEYEKQKLLPGM